MCPERKLQLLTRQHAISVKVAVKRAARVALDLKPAFHLGISSREANFLLFKLKIID
jgi:hypothetical protein